MLTLVHSRSGAETNPTLRAAGLEPEVDEGVNREKTESSDVRWIPGKFMSAIW